jgi:hypothetical protein
MSVCGLTRKNFMRRSVGILIPPEGSWTSNLSFAVVLSLHHDAGAWGTGVFLSTTAAVQSRCGTSKQSRCGRSPRPALFAHWRFSRIATTATLFDSSPRQWQNTCHAKPTDRPRAAAPSKNPTANKQPIRPKRRYALLLPVAGGRRRPAWQAYRHQKNHSPEF